MDFAELLFANAIRERASQFRNQAESSKKKELVNAGYDDASVATSLANWRAQRNDNDYVKMALDEVQGIAALIKKLRE